MMFRFVREKSFAQKQNLSERKATKGNRPKLHRCLLPAIALLAFCPQSASASIAFTGSTSTAFADRSFNTMGYQFEVFSTVTVIRLGVLDTYREGEGADGWDGQPSAFVGLWNETGTLLASAEVMDDSLLDPNVFAGSNPTSGSFEGQFRSEAISSVVLTPGKYRVAASLADITDSGRTDFFAIRASGIDSRIGNIEGAITSTRDGFPDLIDDPGRAYSGGTVFFQAVAVPEPTFCALGFAMAGLFLRRQR